MHLDCTITKSEVIVDNSIVIGYEKELEVTAICELVPEYSVRWVQPYVRGLEQIELFKGRKIKVDLSNPIVKRIYTDSGLPVN